MLRRLKSFINGTEAISHELKAETSQILDSIIIPEKSSVNLDLLSCFQFIKSVVNAGRYAPDEFLLVLETLEYLTVFEMALKKEAEIYGQKD